MLDIHSYISENRYLSQFKWDISIVNHTVHQLNKIRFEYPIYNVQYEKGIYIFYNQLKQCLYVGEAGRHSGSLKKRLQKRFCELHGKVDKGYEYHGEFLQENQDSNMVILTTPIEDNKQRLLAEEYLTTYLQPEFIRYKFNRFYKRN